MRGKELAANIFDLHLNNVGCTPFEQPLASFTKYQLTSCYTRICCSEKEACLHRSLILMIRTTYIIK